uniref:DUF305 domain-containing protein n=1 Tax=viral metagenome TaxID=1070528 RepID=A0A6C0B3F6_9ZZZZ
MNIYKTHSIQFIIMVIVGILFNPMNILAYRINDLYISLTLFYGGILMASNMVWAHEIIHYLSMGHFNMGVFIIGIIMSVATSILLLRKQLCVNDNQWLKRMISHHSTALTTSKIISKKSKNNALVKLANDIVDTQEKEIKLMKSLIV